MIHLDTKYDAFLQDFILEYKVVCLFLSKA